MLGVPIFGGTKSIEDCIKSIALEFELFHIPLSSCSSPTILSLIIKARGAYSDTIWTWQLLIALLKLVVNMKLVQCTIIVCNEQTWCDLYIVQIDVESLWAITMVEGMKRWTSIKDWGASWQVPGRMPTFLLMFLQFWQAVLALFIANLTAGALENCKVEDSSVPGEGAGTKRRGWIGVICWSEMWVQTPSFDGYFAWWNWETAVEWCYG